MRLAHMPMRARPARYHRWRVTDAKAGAQECTVCGLVRRDRVRACENPHTPGNIVVVDYSTDGVTWVETRKWCGPSGRLPACTGGV